ncbi:DMT family transporter [Streptomyces sp. NPDC020917]|uniref:DMT family transporter n=1 Tax=Streptomyces sp. NPDC020917 TaxID=3365102 RepID=UPI003788B283
MTRLAADGTAPRLGWTPSLLMAGGLVALLSLTWLLSGALVARAEPFAVAAGRATSSFVGLSLVAAARSATRRPALKAATRRPVGAVVLGALGVFGYSAASVWAIGLIGAATTNVILTLLPCMTFLLGLWLFHEPPGAAAVMGTCVAVASAAAYGLLDHGRGLGIRGEVTPSRALLGVLAALAAVVAMAFYSHLYGRLAPDTSSLVALPSVFGAGATMLLLPALARGAFGSLTPAQWGEIVLLGCGVYVPAYVIQHELLLRRGPLFTTSVSLAVPFCVRLCTWGLGKAGPPSPLVAVLLLACCCGVLLTLPRTRNHTPGPATPGAAKPTDHLPRGTSTHAQDQSRP